jgi:hypothetical protein
MVAGLGLARYLGDVNFLHVACEAGLLGLLVLLFVNMLTMYLIAACASFCWATGLFSFQNVSF